MSSIKKEVLYTVTRKGDTYHFLSEDKALAFIAQMDKVESYSDIIDIVQHWRFTSVEELVDLMAKNYKELQPLLELCQ
jgi:hypothetical protein